MRVTLIAFNIFLWFFSGTLHSQENSNPWNFISEKNIVAEKANRQIIPNAYATAAVNLNDLSSVLSTAPLWFTEDAERKTVELTLPMPNGKFEKFSIVNAPTMHPDLAAKYPEISTYAGTGITDQTAYIRLDLTPQGFHGMIKSGKHSTVFIDPYAKNDVNNYISYYKKDFTAGDSFECLFEGEEKSKSSSENSIELRSSGDCQFRTYRLAVAATGEYTAFHGGTVADGIAAINTTVNRINAVFEADLNISFQLIANNNLIVYTNAGTDPYTNGNAGAMLNENQANVNSVIGSANYDLGHLFGTGGSGLAGLGVVCSNSNKAKGITGIGNPIGDPFDIDYVAHEIGHQLGANHTQNNGCNRNNNTAVEPGSASTIMGYAGICSPNVQNNSDDHFHTISILEMQSEILSHSSCPVPVNTGNNAPTANAGADVTVPKSTPLILDGIATDADNDPLTYCWEQTDNEVATMPPVSTNDDGPAFRSNSPVASPIRYLPNIGAITSNSTPTWEVLPSVSRTLNFTLTVRDNHVGGGCAEEDEIVITVDGASGPFVVTSPNTAVNWAALSTQTITWNKAGTDVPPVNASNVDIFLSTDGGLTYPHTVATGVTNDGSHDVVIPDQQTTNARIMVRGSGNIFFDISNTDFTISAPQNDFSLAVSPASQAICTPADADYVVTIGSVGSFSGNVTLSTANVPAGATASFTSTAVSVPPTGMSTLTIGNTSSLAPGNYVFDILATGSTGTKSFSASLFVSNAAPSAPMLTTPADAETGVAPMPSFSWGTVALADTYEIEIASDAGFNTIVETASGLTGTSYDATTALAVNTTYYWHVRGDNDCGAGVYSTDYSFTTANEICDLYTSANVPITIPTNVATVTSTLNISSTSGTMSDVNISDLDISHTWVEDLRITIISPDGTEVILADRLCDGEDDFFLSFDDEASNNYGSIPCPPVGGASYQPDESLTAFDGKEISGTWTLKVEDLANLDGGTINGWGLDICHSPPAAPVCVAPSVFTVSNIKDDRAIVSWQAVSGATKYNLGYRPVGGAWIYKSTIQLSRNLTGLTSGTTYEYRARTDCGSGYTSWSPIETFTTDACGFPVSSNITNIQGTEATVNWSAIPGATVYKIHYREVGTNAWTNRNSTPTSKVLTSLTPGTDYEYRMKTRCPYGWSAWSGLNTFTTDDCGFPTGLNATNLAPTSVTINWNTVPNAIRYRVTYKEVGTSTWINESSTTTFENLTGLNSDTDYEYRMKTSCPYGWSNWSALESFTTPPVTLQNPNVNARTGTPTISQPELFPNPVSEVLSVVFESTDEANMPNLTIMDLTGRTVKKDIEVTPFSGVGEVQINVRDLPTGTYILNITSRSGNQNSKFVKF